MFKKLKYTVMKFLITKRRVLRVEEKENGCLLITDKEGKEIENAGAFILSNGGKEKLLSRCITKEEKEKNDLLKKESMKNFALEEEKEKDEAKKAFDKLLLQEVIDTNVENLKVILNYFKTMNWGAWPRIKMSIPCKFLQYDCDGQIITAVKISEKINCGDEMIDKFKVGGSVKSLPNYKNIERY